MKISKIVFLSTSLLLAGFLTGCHISNGPVGPSGNPGGGGQETSPGISLSYDSLTLYVGKTVTLKATITPLTASQEAIWSSSDTSVATVNNGVITTLKVGTTNIVAKTSDGQYSATCVLTVVEEEEETPYVPDENDPDIYFITESTLSQGTYSDVDDEYTFAPDKNYKQIYVNVPDETIIIELNGITVENSENSPIYVEDCDNIEISAKKGTTNYIKDTRPTYISDMAGQGKGAIYVVNGDLKLKGTGTLNITANYLNGVHGKDDVKVQKLTLNVTAVNHGIRGNDSVTITSGTVNISCGGDGLHSENSDISSKENQKGNVTINGGTLTINSWSDALQAAYDAIIEETDPTNYPLKYVAKTNKYSSYSGATVDTSTASFYLKMNSSTYSNGGYTYAAYINGEWVRAAYKGTQSNSGQGGPGGGGSRTYYIYEIEKPSGASSFTLYRFKGSNVTSFSTDSYNAVSDAKAFNDAYDMVEVSVSSGKISFGSWSNYGSSNDISAKGIKAENEIYIKSGTIEINAYDDAIHANNDGLIENGSAPLGNVNISGGTLTLSASDDGIHADGQLNISGGTTTITSSYEGLEGNVINVSGGSTYVYATDDGVNATTGSASASITINGGFLDVEVPSNGDTDGIDSNGTFTLNDGVVIVKGPGSASGSMGGGAAALDTDGAVTLKSGTIVVFGGIERTPSTSLTKTICSSNAVSTGSHSVSFSGGTSYSTTLKSSTRGCVVYSSLGSATLN